MNNNINKWMEFSNEYAQLMNDNFKVMNRFWTTTLDQHSGYGKKNVELFFDHMNRNVEIMHEIYTNASKTNEELQPIFKDGIEKFNARFQKVYEETMKNITPKTNTNAQ
ncbi:MAG TPA: hypothetical protein PLM07_01885 [Candidatus Rifleibacterium sp.]|nr:hypothetical protein [Candidatus Rifleibacterium sp.]HPT44630.1 hypothetical protein [Candidatus Rifleibacterium sp.]